MAVTAAAVRARAGRGVPEECRVIGRMRAPSFLAGAGIGRVIAEAGAALDHCGVGG
ncbi:hypothetical protein GCM10009746_15690 [Microbacterium paludicola]